MKKIQKLCAVLCLALVFVTLFSACKREEPSNAQPPEHTHTYKSVWTMNETHHWKACDVKGCTEVAGKNEHVFGEWKNNDEYQHHKTCTCGAAKKENHAWDEGVITTPATPEASGERIYSCTVCDATKTELVAYLP